MTAFRDAVFILSLLIGAAGVSEMTHQFTAKESKAFDEIFKDKETKMTNSNETYLSDNQLAKRYDVSRVTIWRWSSQGRLAAPVKLSPGCTRWRMSDVLEFEEGLV